MTEDGRLYRVRWEIEVEAETPQHAAEKARHYQTKPGTTATCSRWPRSARTPSGVTANP
jgi:hypothetical protein